MHNLETRYKAVVHYTHFQRSLRYVSKLYGVSKSSLHRWIKNSPSYKKCVKKRCVKDDVRKCIENCLKGNPFLTMQELASFISKECNIQRSGRTINRYVKNLDITLKSAFRMVNVVHDNEKVKEYCKNFIDAYDSNNLISIDETGFYVGDHRRKGWSQKGKRLAIKSDKSLRRVKFTVIMAVANTGLVGYEVLDHNCKKADFVKFVQTLKAPKGSVFLMDNIPFHHSKEVIDVIKVKECNALFTIPYSPRINPIENVFGMIKPLYRQRCPCEFTKSFNYKQLFENITIDYLQGRSLSNFFNHVRTIARETIDGIDADHQGFVFNGYDL